MTSTAASSAATPEIMDAAAAACVALSASGTDTLLMAADHALARTEPPHPRGPHRPRHRPGRARGHHRRGAGSSPGDLIIRTRNDTPQGRRARPDVANGDLLRIEAITPGGLLVRRALDAHPRSGQRRWTDRRFVFKTCKDAELGDAVTDHAAQGRTVRPVAR